MVAIRLSALVVLVGLSAPAFALETDGLFVSVVRTYPGPFNWPTAVYQIDNKSGRDFGHIMVECTAFDDSDHALSVDSTLTANVRNGEVAFGEASFNRLKQPLQKVSCRAATVSP